MRNLELAKQYPNLFISINHVVNKFSEYDSWGVWVCRDGRDAESICYHECTPVELEALNEEVGKALQEGWFWCTGCHKSYPRTEYAYFHFAGNYCKECEVNNPEAARRARNENYE